MTKKKDGKRRRKASKARVAVASLGIKCRPGSGPHQQARRKYVELVQGVGPTELPTPNKNISHKFVGPGKLATVIKKGQLGIFCVQVQWPDCGVLDPPGQADTVIQYDEEIFQEVDSGTTSSVAVFGKPEGNEGFKRFLCFKASQRQREEVKRMWPDTRTLEAVAACAPHTNEAAKKAKYKVEAMQCHFGLPSWFLTVTPDDENSVLLQVYSGNNIKLDVTTWERGNKI